MDQQPSERPDPSEGVSQVPVGVDEAEMMALPSDPVRNIAADQDAVKPPLDTAEQQVIEAIEREAHPPAPNDGATLPARPALRRDKSAPAPQRLPPPAPPAPPYEPGHQPTDSLSLLQLKKLVTDMPKVEPTPYAFEYDDASSFAQEIEEWFSYSLEEQAMLLKSLSSFVEEWVALRDGTLSNLAAYEQGRMDWCKAEPASREQLVRKLVGTLSSSDRDAHLRSLEALVYIALGCWHETAGLSNLQDEEESSPPANDAEQSFNYIKSEVQIDWIRNGVEIIHECRGIQPIFDIARSAVVREFTMDVVEQEITPHDEREADRRELWCSLTLLYLLHEVARMDGHNSLKQELSELQPDLAVFLIEVITTLRWDDSIGPPQHKVLLLTWKSILINFGGLQELEELKRSFQDPLEETADNRGQPIITASPLDYHLFRQEISSKYPAYNPPPPLFPLEPENNSILPPLKNHQSKASEAGSSGPGVGNINGTSILHQPVHIATPAPSPPPSPAGPGGKGGKKQNYQTNQLFPFLYPPLDESSNNLGGKGSTDLQDMLVGRKWQGSDIPTSISEAAELFANRMRATRAMKQLWEERDLFMKYERGWVGPEDGDIEPLELDKKLNAIKFEDDKAPEECNEHQNLVAKKLDRIDKFYSAVLPHLQSLVIVLLRTFLSHLATLALQSNSPTAVGMEVGQNGGPGDGSPGIMIPDMSRIPLEDLDRMRTEEIQDKAASGILILLLKWFKVSHILKMEYLTQLLVDSNYIPLTLKLLQLQEIEKAINYKCDREDLNFFYFCRTHSREGLKDAEAHAGAESDEHNDPDEAVPPPIRRQPSADSLLDSITEDPSIATGEPGPSIATDGNGNHLPEVDELGIPVTNLPTEPITSFSWRNFFSNINLLRIMQKICKNKAHRNLMLVQYKSSQYLRKSLKIPQPQLRLYTLKLFKNQVPYCGRKWRQANMRVITAVYLHCRPELRDDWLAGSDVDADVDESVPLEQALRALTHWFNLKRYPERLGAEPGVLAREQDFFRRELERLGWAEMQAHAQAAAAAQAAAEEAAMMGDAGAEWEAQGLVAGPGGVGGGGGPMGEGPPQPPPWPHPGY
ncbi:hypothetical protein BKA81DRAFT_297942 [Phyllosticta paracitricarpa]|uniref:Uncharacterized protein n=1 Tax=Phyllosticta paracitricarpa TaxID=2016321 RepID=A0ABR1N0D2_9PEZI